MKKKRIAALIFTAMRITVAQLVLAALFTFSGYANSVGAQTILEKKITISARNIEMKKILSSVQQQTGIRFIFGSKAIRAGQKVTVNLQDRKLIDFFETVLGPLNIGYKIVDDQIMLFPQRQNNETMTAPDQSLSTEEIYKPDRVVSGSIVDEKGQPLRGVSVVVKNTTRGTTTDADGNFRIGLREGENELLISSTGFETKEISLGREDMYRITLKETVTNLNDVVVVGYGTVRKANLTASVSSVTSKDIGDRVSGSVASLLQGRASGLDITGDEIRVRGVSTPFNTQPLVVIDGIQGGNLSSLNANDIERIDVLKDPSSTAIYGVYGGNGVILVTTKKGRLGPVRISVNAFAGFSRPAKELKVLNTGQYIDLVKEMYTNNGQVNDLSQKFLNPGTDILNTSNNFQDQTQKTGYNQEYNVNFSGGAEKSNYFISLLYKRSTPVQIGNRVNETFGFRAKNNFDVKKWVRIGTNLALNFNITKGRMAGNDAYRVTYAPYLSLRDTSNSWGLTNVNRSTDLTDQYNPIRGILGGGTTKSIDYQANFFTELEPIPGLVYRFQAGVAGNYNSSWGWSPRSVDGGSQTNFSNFTQGSGYYINLILENILSYTKNIGDHDLLLLAGTSNTSYDARSESVSGLNFINERYDILRLSQTQNIQTPSQSFGKDAGFSYFGRFNYSFKSRYLLSANFRANTSPNFAPVNRWGYFPAVSAAWKLNEEPFMEGKIKNLSQLKPRINYGSTGNDNTQGAFRYNSLVSNNSFWPSGQNSTVINQGSTVYVNSSNTIKWETVTSKGAGLDVGFYENRLNFTVDYFDRQTKGILIDAPLPVSLGYGGNSYGGDPVVNAASVNNKGWEFLVNYQGRKGTFSYSITGNLTLVKNRVTGLGIATGAPYVVGVSRFEPGFPIGYYYGYVANGIYRTSAEIKAANDGAQAKYGYPYFDNKSTSAGDVRFKDINGDGHITAADRTKLGSPIPTFTYGTSIFLQYKGFDMNFVLQGVGGNQLYYSNYNDSRGMVVVKNQETYVLNRWKSESDQGNGIVPRAINTDPAQNNRMSTLKIESGAYLRLKQISIGYRLPAGVTSKIGFRGSDNLRFYVSANNLLTFTKFTGFDPEVGGSPLSRGYAGLGYPTNRQVVIGAKIDF